MFFIASKILDIVFEPLSWVLMLVAAGAVLRWRAKPRAASVCVLAATVSLMFFSSPWVAVGLSRWLEAGVVSTADFSQPYDAVVLLGGAVDYGGTQGDEVAFGDNVERLHATFELLRADKARVAVLSGGVPGGRQPEALLLRRVLSGWGIAPDRLLVEDASLNTQQNAVNVAALAHRTGLRRLLLVTSAYHMPRAHGCFRAAGLQVDLYPVDRRAAMVRHPGVWPRASALDASSRALRELAGRLVYLVSGYVRR